MTRDFSRQTDIVPEDKLKNLKIAVIGCGAIGRQVGLQLVAMGAKSLHLIDFDVVEETNKTTQGYLTKQVGLQKVVALGNSIVEVDDDIDLTITNDRWRPKHDVGDVVFCCVDSISAREKIWKGVKDKVQFWCDGRMLAEVMKVLPVSSPEHHTYYKSTLFKQEEAVTGRCTAQSTIYTGAICAGLMLHQFTRWLRGLPTEREVEHNLLRSIVTVVEDEFDIDG